MNKEKLEQDTKEAWEKVAEIQLNSKDDTFVLPKEAVDTREAYCREFNVSRQDFIFNYYGPIFESKKAAREG